MSSGYRTLYREALGNFSIWHVAVSNSNSNNSNHGSSLAAAAAAAAWRVWAACGDGVVRGYYIQEKSNEYDDNTLDASACQCILTHVLLGSSSSSSSSSSSLSSSSTIVGRSQVQVVATTTTTPEDNDNDDSVLLLVIISLSMDGKIQVYRLGKETLEYNKVVPIDNVGTTAAAAAYGNDDDEDKNNLDPSDHTQQKKNATADVHHLEPDHEFQVENATGTCMRAVCNKQDDGSNNIVMAVPCLDGSIAIVVVIVAAAAAAITGMSNKTKEEGVAAAGTVVERYFPPQPQQQANNEGRPNIAMSIDWHPQQPGILAVGRKDGLVEVLMVAMTSSPQNTNSGVGSSGEEKNHRLIHHEAPVRCLSYTPDGHLLATCSDDGMLCLWDMSRQQQLVSPPVLVHHVTHAHASWIFSIEALPDSRRFVTTGADAKIHVWSVDAMAKGPVHTFTAGSSMMPLTTTTTAAATTTTTTNDTSTDGGESGESAAAAVPEIAAHSIGCVWTIASFCHDENDAITTTKKEKNEQSTMAARIKSSTVAPRLVSGSEFGEIQIYGTAHGNRPFVPRPLPSTSNNHNDDDDTAKLQQAVSDHSSSLSTSSLTLRPPSDFLIPGQTRIRDGDGFVGTVAYVGPVASSKSRTEIYAGIVWDDESRGKHDGSVICRQTNTIVRHFSCSRPNQGSFLKLKKVDTGIPLTASLLKSKYVEMNAPVIAPNNVLPHTATTSSGKELPIEFLGELKIRERQQLQDVDKISLRRSGISRASNDDDEQFQEYRQIKEIDLAGNLLWQWFQVLKIMRQFPSLEHFSIAYNYVRDVGGIKRNPALFGMTFDRIHILNLNHCAITSFATIQWVADTMPNLESLCVANNDLSDLSSMQVSGLEHLQRLDCSNCRLDSWQDQVAKFGRLFQLESLSLDDNAIASIPRDAGLSAFPQLTSLQIPGNAFSNWMDLEGINSFAKLKVLRLKNLPLTAELGQAEVRSLCLARYPQLEILNGSIISNTERVDAEKRYVAMLSHMLQRRPMVESLKVVNDDILAAEHPRFAELKEKYHNLVVVSGGSNGRTGGGENNLASSVLNVTLKSMAPSSCTMEPVMRRLPDTLTVERVKALCSRLFGGIDYDLIRLRFCNNTDGQSLPVELDDDEKPLNYYGIAADGAEIFMDEVDVVEQARNAQQEQAEQERRMAAHDRTINAMKELKRMG
jgi:tubulin-specific chaperone E